MRIAILTPDPADPARQGRWDQVFARMAEPLTAAGAQVAGPAWTDAGDLTGYDLVLPLMVWGYHRAGDRWAGQVSAWEAAGARVQNPASVLLWNADKGYLGRLAERGAPVPSTLYVDRVTPEVMAEAAASFGTDRLVAKPRVSAIAYQTLRWSPGEPLDAGPEGPALIQPYLPAIEQHGELSMFFLGGAYSHAVRKVPRAGDFRVQPEYEGVTNAADPSPDEQAAAEAILAAVQEPLLYARVDLVRGLDDRPVLMELELVEPDLFLGHAPDRGRRFVEVALDRARAA
ncbi:MAG: transporter [Proteobacteria bacterium]|nr:transporter [Pseudomonadota bacterium]